MSHETTVGARSVLAVQNILQVVWSIVRLHRRSKLSEKATGKDHALKPNRRTESYDRAATIARDAGTNAAFRSVDGCDGCFVVLSPSLRSNSEDALHVWEKVAEVLLATSRKDSLALSAGSDHLRRWSLLKRPSIMHDESSCCLSDNASKHAEDSTATWLHTKPQSPDPQGGFTAQEAADVLLAGAHLAKVIALLLELDKRSAAMPTSVRDSSPQPATGKHTYAFDEAPSAEQALLDEYYDEAGNIRLLGQKLVRLDQRHVEQLTSRQLLQDQDDDLSVSDDEFAHRFVEDRKPIEQAIDVASARATALKKQCEEAGLEIKTFRDINGLPLARHSLPFAMQSGRAEDDKLSPLTDAELAELGFEVSEFEGMSTERIVVTEGREETTSSDASNKSNNSNVLNWLREGGGSN